jgi:hypothetical protein
MKMIIGGTIGFFVGIYRNEIREALLNLYSKYIKK